MDSAFPQDSDLPSRAPIPLPKEDLDLLADFEDFNVPSSKIEPAVKEPTPEPELHARQKDLFDSFSAPVKSDLEDAVNLHFNDPVKPISDVKVPDVSVLPESNFFDEKDLPKRNSTPDVLEALKEPAAVPEPQHVEEAFGFNKPLPPEPVAAAVLDFLKAETNGGPNVIEDKDDDLTEFVGAKGDSSPATFSREESPIPPPVPKHQNLRDESPDRFESSPEPDFKPMDSGKEIEEPEPRASELIFMPATITPPSKKEEPKQSSSQERIISEDIGGENIINKFMESLVYWRDPRKSGVVFGVLMVTLLSLTTFSLISVLSYIGLISLAGTITFRVYKNVMQAVQKTSDGHPFKDLLDVEISLPEEKVAELSRIAARQFNAWISALRSIFLVEDIIDSIKGLVLFWALTYVGAIFNGLTLLIIGVILLFALPRLYEQNKAQVDAYIQIAMDKLSIITNWMKAAIPSGNKDEKPKDQ